MSHLTTTQQGYIAAGILVIAAILLFTARRMAGVRHRRRPHRAAGPRPADTADDTAVIYTVGRHRPDYVEQHQAAPEYRPLYSPAFAAAMNWPMPPRPDDTTQVLPAAQEVQQ